MTPDLESLKAACEHRIPAEVLEATKLEAVSVGGLARLYAETSESGNGLHAIWLTTSWLVDPSTCSALGLSIEGARGVEERWTSFQGTGTDAERSWPLARAGFQALDASKPEHALSARALETPEPVEPRSLTLGRLRVDATAAPPLDWHAGPAPSRFDPAWISADDSSPDIGVCPCYRVPHPRPLVDHVSTHGSFRFHEYISDPMVLTWAGGSALVVEDPARHRWAFFGGGDGPDSPVGTNVSGEAPDSQSTPAPTPTALRGWRWSQVPDPSDPGVTGLVADGAQPWIWVSFQLQIQDDHGGWEPPARISWVQGGLSVQPFDGGPILLPTATLLELLGP